MEIEVAERLLWTYVNWQLKKGYRRFDMQLSQIPLKK